MRRQIPAQVDADMQRSTTTVWRQSHEGKAGRRFPVWHGGVTFTQQACILSSRTPAKRFWIHIILSCQFLYVVLRRLGGADTWFDKKKCLRRICLSTENWISHRRLFFRGHRCSRGRGGQKYKISVLVLSRQMARKKIFVIDPQPTIRLLATVRAIIRPASRPCVKWETLSLWWSQLQIFTPAQGFEGALVCCLEDRSPSPSSQPETRPSKQTRSSVFLQMWPRRDAVR